MALRDISRDGNWQTGGGRLLTAAEVAAGLGVSRRTVARLVRDRRIPVVRVGRCVRFLPVDLHAFVEDNRREGYPGTDG